MAKRDPKETLDAARELAKQLGSNTSAVEAYLKVQEKVKEIQDAMVDKVKEQAIANNDQVKAAQQVADAYQRQQDRQKQLNDLTQKYVDKWRDFKEIAQDPRIARGLFLAASAKKASEIASAFKDMQHDAGLAYTQTFQMAGTLASSVKSGFMLGVGFKASAKAAGALANELGDISKVNSEVVVQVASMAKSYGVAEAEGAKVFKQMKAISGAADEIVVANMKSAIELARAKGVAPGKVMSAIASDTEFFAGFAKEGGKNIAATAVQAAKLGISMSDVSTMLNGILDVESSIEKEMEASVLLNRQISFDKARQLAMEGDTLGATKAILDQVGGVAEFQSMSIVQRKALAEAAGVELSTMQQMVSSRESQIEMGLVEASTTEKIMKTVMGTGSFLKENLTVMSSGLNVVASLKNTRLGEFAATAAHNAKQLVFFAAEKAHVAYLKMFKGGKGVTKNNMLDRRTFKGGGFTGGKGMTPAVGKGAGGFMKGLNPTSLVKGAAAMVLMGAALFVAAKGFQELAKVEWGALFPGAVIALVALTAAMVGIGLIAPYVLMGSLAFGAMSVALLLFGTALNVVAGALPMMVSPLMQLAEIGGMALMSIGLGFGAMGMGLVSMAGGLALITPMLPTLLAVGGLAAMGMNLFGGGGEDKKGGDNIIAEKLDTLILLISQGGTINMDGKKVGDVIALAQGPLGS